MKVVKDKITSTQIMKIKKTQTYTIYDLNLLF